MGNAPSSSRLDGQVSTAGAGPPAQGLSRASSLRRDGAESPLYGQRLVDRTRRSLHGPGYHSQRSIDLPDFRSMAHMTGPVARVGSTLPSEPIPIPIAAATVQRPAAARPVPHDSIDDIVGLQGQDARRSHYALESKDSSPNFASSAPRGPASPEQGPRTPAAARSTSSLGYTSRSSRARIVPDDSADVIQSSISLGIPSARTLPEPGAHLAEVPTLITWRPDRSSVVPSVASPRPPDPNNQPDVWVQERYNGRTRLTYKPERGLWSETVRLPVGNMTLKFFVDEQQHIVSDMPLAPEDDGELVNYVTVLLPSGVQGTSREGDLPYSASTWLRQPGANDDPSGSAAPWTSEIPAQLINAQREEEDWRAYQQLPPEQQREVSPPRDVLHPKPPQLPRHLDKPVLAVKTKKSPSSHHPPAATTPGRASKSKDKKAPGKRVDRDRHGPSPLSQEAARADAEPRVLPPTVTTPGGSRAIAVDAPHGDDDAVLPVPSHVVLHHLGTSAIRDGVIAVCDTVRYKKKYITTVFYKPMFSEPDPELPAAELEPGFVPRPPPVPELQQPPLGSGQQTPALSEADC